MRSLNAGNILGLVSLEYEVLRGPCACLELLGRYQNVLTCHQLTGSGFRIVATTQITETQARVCELIYHHLTGSGLRSAILGG
jgi:hypothetical protein